MTRLPLALAVACLLPAASSADPLHTRIDALIDAAARGQPASPPADDAEFLRRASLDLTGTIPTARAARAFLGSKAADRRARLIDTLLASPGYPRRMQDLFHVVLMERLGDHPAWSGFLHTAFARNRPFDEMARDMLRGRAGVEAKGATFFLSKRLENYGQNPVDYPALARDVGRLFLGKDLRCAQCHDHLFIKSYKQADFQGLLAFVQGAFVQDAANLVVGERPLTGKLTFQSVFAGTTVQTGPRLPGGREIAIPAVGQADLYLTPPDRRKGEPGALRFSPLEQLARAVPASPDFSRNLANRLWWAMMGRGLVHPLDQHHADNPPSHPALLDLLARELVAKKFDVKHLLREVALTKAYGRSSRLPKGVTKSAPERFLTAIEKRLSAEQMLWAVLEATGERERLEAARAPAPAKGKPAPPPLEQARLKFIKAFAGPAREPEDEIGPTLKGALFLLNDPLILGWLQPRAGNLIDRLSRLPDARVADELYLSVLTRPPDAEEGSEVRAELKGKAGRDRAEALGRLAWALLASTELAMNH